MMGLGSIIKGATKAISSATGVTGGDLLGFAGGLLGNSSANSSARAAAGASNEFTQKMMTNRHQWEVNDLRKAGLNPILSAGGTPSMGNSAQADVFNPVTDAMNAQSSALATKRLKADIANIDANIQKTNSDTDLNRVLADTSRSQQILNAASAKAAMSNSNNIDIMALLNRMQVPGAKINEDWSKTKTGRFFGAMGKMVSAISPFGHSAASLRNSD